MKWNAVHAISAVLAPALIAALAVQVHAGSCEGSNRIDHDAADCLDADWDNSTNWLSHGKVWARSQCSDSGTVVAKVDIKNAKDKTWHLNDDSKRSSGTGIYNVRNVYCCADLSDLCNKSDIHTQACVDEFEKSSAASTCRNTYAGVNSNNRQCDIHSECQLINGYDYTNTSIAAKFSETETLVNCKGYLKVGSC